MKRDLMLGALAALSVAAALVLGQIATFPNLAPWYAGLVKPSFNPPNWVFGPVWTTLYVLMAFALWRVLRSDATAGRRVAVALFYLQLLLNAAWPWMFFAAQSPGLGMINIAPQLIAILGTIVAFSRIDRVAGACLVPLAAWVGYATALNFALWRLNG
ncbi:TspO/MBR family protein [Dongia sedimenti]|uniref:TspO/MBR family protein n=1 Tax=Dongia sedimenti TaxID=3064282 RepID=A0ABU0YNE1_9PROT|nr:TspO/MBR family protein [Rhodospirillaceae bacterium R-7]